MKSKTTDYGLQLEFNMEEVQTLEDFFGQFTYDTILKIFRAGDYPDALDGKDSETGFEKGGFDAPHRKIIDNIYNRIQAYCVANGLEV